MWRCPSHPPHHNTAFHSQLSLSLFHFFCLLLALASTSISLASVKGKSLFSRGFLECSACCGCLAGGRTFSRSLVGLKVPVFHPGQHISPGWFGLSLADSDAAHEGQVSRSAVHGEPHPARVLPKQYSFRTEHRCSEMSQQMAKKGGVWKASPRNLSGLSWGGQISRGAKGM